MVDYYNSYQRPPYYRPGYDHTQQEEEWDPGALLDPTWEKQQKKVRIRPHSRLLALMILSFRPLPHGATVTCARRERVSKSWKRTSKAVTFSFISLLYRTWFSGLKLMLLLEVISGEPLPRPDRGKMKFHRIANVAKALSYIESKGVKLVSIAPEGTY